MRSIIICKILNILPFLPRLLTFPGLLDDVKYATPAVRSWEVLLKYGLFIR